MYRRHTLLSWCHTLYPDNLCNITIIFETIHDVLRTIRGVLGAHSHSLACMVAPQFVRLVAKLLRDFTRNSPLTRSSSMVSRSRRWSGLSTFYRHSSQ